MSKSSKQPVNNEYINQGTSSIRKSEFLARKLGVATNNISGGGGGSGVEEGFPLSSGITAHIEIENEIPEILGRLNSGESIQEARFNTKPIMPVKPRTTSLNLNQQQLQLQQQKQRVIYVNICFKLCPF